MDKVTAPAASGSDSAPKELGNRRASLADRRADMGPFAVFLYIWGLEWLASSLLLFFDPGEAFGVWRQAALITAVLATAAAYLWSSRGGRRAPRVSIGAAMPVLAAALVIVVLLHNGAIDVLYIPLLKGIVLTAAYGALSLRLGRPLLYMSLWMLALTFTVFFAYLGYASVLLGTFGGLSLIALGFLCKLWRTIWKKGNAIR